MELVALRLLANILANAVNTLIKEYIKENLEKDLVINTILKLVKEEKTCHFWEKDEFLWAKWPLVYPEDLKLTNDTLEGVL